MVKKECANYFRDGGVTIDYCCWYDSKCKYFEDINNRCGYFEQSVLPLDKEYQIVYHAQRKNMDKRLSAEDKEHLINAGKVRIKCAECGGLVYANSNRQKYCSSCSKKRAREKARARVQKHREKAI